MESPLLRMMKREEEEEEDEEEDNTKVLSTTVFDEEDKQFVEQWEKRVRMFGGIIALKGLPSTGKTRLAKQIGKWAKCPVLCIQDFLLDDHYYIKKKKVERDQNEQLLVQEAAFTNLCKAAKRNLSKRVAGSSRVVVIKSRLDNIFEVERLLELSGSTRKKFPLLIIECRIRNEYLWNQRFVYLVGDQKPEEKNDWYNRPMSWKDLEKVRDAYYANSQALEDWDLRLQKRDEDDPPIARRLVIDPYDDIFFAPADGSHGLPNDFTLAVKYLLTAPKQELNTSFENPYVLEFSRLRPYLFEKRLSIAASNGRSENLCPHGDCLFEALDVDDHAANLTCGVCEKKVTGAAYACRLCILVLHKPCAERIDFKALDFGLWTLHCFFYTYFLKENQACKSCAKEGKGFSRNCGSCVLQTHLKCGPLPTIINHNSHQDFLSLKLLLQRYFCLACGEVLKDYAYCCKKYALYYHLECALLPLQVLKHEHGGYEHVMKLKYNHQDHAMEKEEAYWCDSCYKDMNPELWFYSCQECPYYAAHIECTTDDFDSLSNLKDAKFVPQIQRQLEAARAEKAKSELLNNG